MSQVVCVKDNLAEKRQNSLQAEKKIDTDGAYRKWHKPVHQQAPKIENTLLRPLIGVAFLLWAGIGFSAVVVFLLVAIIFKLVGRTLPRSNS